MRRVTILMVLAMAFAVPTSEAAKPASKPPTSGRPTITKTQTPKAGATKAGTVKVSASKGSTVKAVKPAKATTQVAKGGGQTKVSDSKSLKSAKADTGMAKADKSVKADAKTTKAEARSAKAGSSTTSTTSSPSTSTSTIDFTATKAGALLEKNSALRSKIEAKLLAAGYTGSVYEAAYGFKNVGQLNAATNMVQQNHGTSFELLKVLMTGTYVDPATHLVYRTQKLPDGTIQLVKPELATNTASTLSLGQAKQTISGGAVMPEIVVYTTTGTSTTTTGGTLTTTAARSKAKKNATTTQPGGGL